MKRKLNCWEFKNCGREKGGIMAAELGECPVAFAWSSDGMHDGIAGGRNCWEIRRQSNQLAADNICRGSQCTGCEFRRRVTHEEQAPTRVPELLPIVAETVS